MGCRHANCAPETLPVGETGVARARADRPEGDRPTCTSLTLMRLMTPFAGAEGRGDRPVRRRSRFTLARARAEPFHVLFQVSGRAKSLRAAGAEMGRVRVSSGWGRSGAGDGRSVFHSRVGYRMNAFRRGLTSDLARASAHGRPTGLSRMSLTFRSAPGLTSQGSALKAPLAAPPDRSPR